MSEPFLAEIRMIGFNFAPRDWAFCDGQLLPINQNQSLYSLLGTTYGGDGRTSFALPDLRSRTPVHVGDGVQLGQKGGAETITLTSAEMAAHTHTLHASTAAAADRTGSDDLLAVVPESEGETPYRAVEAATMIAMKSDSVSNNGGGQAHNNMQPYLTISYIIALRGLFPSRN